MLGSDLLGIGQKSGVYWALNPDTGTVVWQTQVGPGSGFGGIEWGTAFDGTRIYVPISNWEYLGYSLQPSGAKVNGGSWAALNPSTGRFFGRPQRRVHARRSFRLCARLLGAWAGKRRQRGRVRRLDGREPAEPDDVRP